MEIEIIPMLLWPVSYIVITRSRLLGVRKETVEEQDRQGRSLFFPLTLNSVSYSKYYW